MTRIWAVARHMIAESIRMKIAVVFLVVMAVILLVLPFTVTGDGVTLKSRIQSYLSYSLSSVTFLLSLLTVFLACNTLASEICQRHIFMVASKPIPRWQFFAGKWLGIMTLNAVLLLSAGLIIWAGTWHLKSRPTFEDDRAAIQNEIMTVRYGAKMDQPDFTPMVDARIRKLREDGRLDSVSLNARRGIREDILEELKTGWQTLRPGEYKDYTFSRLLVDREDENVWLLLHFKPLSSAGVDDVIFKARWQCGDREQARQATHDELGNNRLGDVQEGEFIVKRFHTVPVPARTINDEGALHLRIQNITDNDTIVFEGADSFEVLYGIGTFHWNLFRAVSIVWSRLAFLAALGLLASTFLSFPVAAMATFLVLMVATASGFLSDAISGAAPVGTSPDPMWVVGPVLRLIATIFVMLVPDFSKFDPTGTVVAGRVVPLIWVIQSVVKLVLIQGLLLGLLGAGIFTRRELARVTV
ncbi:MAG TPA: ABC transporter permease [Phycisphaerae bacterium]|nr:ABC transporter permease [Phycisphaerae bacterium]